MWRHDWSAQLYTQPKQLWKLKPEKNSQHQHILFFTRNDHPICTLARFSLTVSVVNWQLSKNGSADQYHATISELFEEPCFFNLPVDQAPVFDWIAGSGQLRTGLVGRYTNVFTPFALCTLRLLKLKPNRRPNNIKKTQIRKRRLSLLACGALAQEKGG